MIGQTHQVIQAVEELGAEVVAHGPARDEGRVGVLGLA
jgi:hypothetical protein